MQTVADMPLDARRLAAGLHVVAWGKGRMRIGTILNVGPKNVKLRLVGNLQGKPYEKSVPHAEVFLVPDWTNAIDVANAINGAAAWKVNRRVGVDWGIAIQRAKEVPA